MSDQPKRPTSRRSFLRGSSLVALSAVLAPRLAFGSAGDGQQPPSEPKREPPTAKEPKDQDVKDGEQDPTKITKKDQNGREYRICPECGYNMYRQDRTWTCENCGYSYTE